MIINDRVYGIDLRAAMCFTKQESRGNFRHLLQADGAEGLNSHLALTVNSYLFLGLVYLNLSRKVQDLYFSCVNGQPDFVIKRTGTKVKNFLISPGRTRVLPGSTDEPFFNCRG